MSKATPTADELAAITALFDRITNGDSDAFGEDEGRNDRADRLVSLWERCAETIMRPRRPEPKWMADLDDPDPPQ